MNKEQLKKAVGELNLVDTVFEYDGASYIDTAVSVMQVYDLIDQLDEPEVLSRKWIEEHRKSYTMEDSVEISDLQNLLVPKQEEVDRAYKDGYEKGKEHTFYKGYLEGLADKESEPEKVVIPKFVADWWERDGDSVTLYGGLRVKKKHKFDLVSDYRDKGLGDYLLKVEDWIAENDSAFLDLLNGKPYEVEEEQKYYVLLPEIVDNWRYVSLAPSHWGVTVRYTDTLDDVHEFTEKEIKDYDERYWPFAVEVAE